MPKTIPQLTDATTVNAADELIIHQDGITKRATAAELVSSIRPLINSANAQFSVLDFGAVGDGIADDTAALSAALNSGSHRIIDGANKTYLVTYPITVTSEHIVVQNMTINIASVPDQNNLSANADAIIRFEGVQSAFSNLTTNTVAGSNIVTTSNTSALVSDQYIWLQSDTLFSGSLPLGQYAKIKAIDSGTQFRLHDTVLYDFNTANTARFAVVTPKHNIAIRNVNIVGAQDHQQAALYFRLCADVVIDSCSFLDVDYSCIFFDRCINTVVSSTQCRRSKWLSDAGADGFSYGITFNNGCYNGVVVNGYSEDQRHYVATGTASTAGGVNLFITVANNKIMASRDAGIDAHPTTDYYTVKGNIIEQMSATSGTLDGIIFQGLNCVITDNVVVNAKRHGIFHQVVPLIGSASSVIANNLVRCADVGLATSTSGINISNETAGNATLCGATISGNVVTGSPDQHFIVTSVSGSISSVSITGNVACSNSATTSCRVRAQGAGTSVSDVVVANNVLKTAGTQNLYFLGASSAPVNRISVTGNGINGGTFGIRASFVTTGSFANNEIAGAGTRWNIADCTGIVLDGQREGIRTVSGSNSFTVNATDTDIICNRSGTVTVTLPDAASSQGRVLNIKTIQASAVVSATPSSVVPVDDTTAGTAILPATDGAWAQLKCDGTNWVIMQRG